MAKLTWFGEAVSTRVRDASAAAIGEILTESAADARQQHWWQSRSGHHLEDNIISEPPIKGRRIVAGRFGSTRRAGFYGLFLELRQGFLRPAADRHFPDLPARLEEKYHL